MRPSLPAFVLYVVASFCTIIGIAIKDDFLVLLMKPIIVPAIFFYYMQIKRTKVNWLFLIAMFSSFIADMIILFELKNGDVSIALLNIIMYLIFLYFSIKDISSKSISIFNFYHFLLITITFLVIMYIVLDLMTNLDNFLHNLFIIYGVILSLLSAVIVFNHLKNFNTKTFFALMMCFCFVISDIFFAVYNFYLKMEVFIVLNVTVQFASYYYMVKYFTFNVVNKEVVNEK